MSDAGEIEGKLDSYLALVARWAPLMDLVAPQDLPRFRERHIDDCLRLIPLSDAVGLGPAVDVGSGAGLPGVVMAVSRPQRVWRLLEPRSKRAAFLEEVARDLELDNVEVLALSAQQAAADPGLRGAHQLAVARALAPPERSFDWLRPLVAPGGIAAVFVGKTGKRPQGAEEWAPGIIVEPRSGSDGIT
jgi:16S rRNA (guanine527-N7)-methyltransferase